MTAQQSASPAPDLSPVPVHITGVSAEVSLGAIPAHKGEWVAVPKTVVLTSDEPVKQLLPPDPDLAYALVQVFTNDVVLTKSKGDGQAAANVNDATYANPNGALLATGVVIPIKTTSELWVAAATVPTRVSVIACYKR